MKLYAYIIVHDTGFSPNPFWGYCTLACCKPVIRRTACVGDWIVGLSSKADGNRLVYAMQVEEVLTYVKYYLDCRFSDKIPDYAKEKVIYKCGDNIYKPLPKGGFQQLQSMHSNGTLENLKLKLHDLGGVSVLISRNFYYFGSQPLKLPSELNDLKVSRGHKNRFSDSVKLAFEKFITSKPTGVNSPPTQWPPTDESWLLGCS
jgi:hypothetical protein